MEDTLEDKLDEGIEDEEEDDDKIFGIIPNPLAKLQKDIQSNVDSFFSNIPLIGWNFEIDVYSFIFDFFKRSYFLFRTRCSSVI